MKLIEFISMSITRKKASTAC